MDDLEKFITENKDSFNDREPSDRVWSGVSRKLPGKKQNFQWIWKVATLLFFVSTITLTYINYYKSDVTSPELAELEEFYFTQIDYKKSLVSDLSVSDYAGASNIDKELQKLDAMYMVLKEEWKKKPSKQVLEALTLNLLVRLDLLNNHLEQIQEKDGVEDDARVI